MCAWGIGQKMKPYIAYSRAEPEGGSILIIANTAKEARLLAWRSGECWNVDEWFDQAARWLRDKSILALADQDKLAAGIAHVVTDPLACESCGLWGCGIEEDGTCLWCDRWAGTLLAETIRKWIG